ncbi:hypothetical protein [Calothrix rhizosoleniae]|uniref:hypothetical protein n=1 Tax=Calothrix rhizosoleniae TaxID=888997 RepID=UPI001178387A|nr:hypothetical protein [Calothrix rhizosoleniae]
MNKYIRYIVLLVLCSQFTLAGCSADSDRSTNNSSQSTVPAVKNSQENSSTTNTATAKKEGENYNSVDFSQLPQGVSLMGSDPKEIAIAVFPPPEEKPQEGNFQRNVSVNTIEPNFKTVIITETGLLDDSVNGIRHRADFESSGTDSKSWKMVWVGKQYKCQPGRGSQDWSSKLCL